METRSIYTYMQIQQMKRQSSPPDYAKRVVGIKAGEATSYEHVEGEQHPRSLGLLHVSILIALYI